MLKITAKIVPLQEYACGSGLGAVGYADSVVSKTSDRYPLVTKSHLTGKIRDAVEDLCDFLRISVCESGDEGGTLCGVYPIKGMDRKYFCPLCKIFGSGPEEGYFRFSLAQYSDEIKRQIANVPTQELYQVERNTRINSIFKTAKEKHLRSKEVVAVKLPLEFKVRQKKKLNEEESDLIIGLLYAGLRFTRFIGAGRSRGRGNIIISLDGVEGYEDKINWLLEKGGNNAVH